VLITGSLGMKVSGERFTYKLIACILSIKGIRLLFRLKGYKMKQTVNNTDFHSAFGYMNRLNNFTYEARNALFDYLEQLEEDTGVEYELDVIALCCTYSQDTWQDIVDNYHIDLDGFDTDEEKIEAVKNYLEDYTTVIDSFDDGTILYAAF
jgi:hypothetical protein